MIWEHYHADWSIDWEYNLHDKTNIFRPWGFQPGHLTEWAKLLLVLDRHACTSIRTRAGSFRGPASCSMPLCQEPGTASTAASCMALRPMARFAMAINISGYRPSRLRRQHCSAQEPPTKRYWDWYDRIWCYSWKHFVDHRYGAWYRILTHDNRKYSDEKSPAGKTDYHTMGACYEVLGAL